MSSHWSLNDIPWHAFKAEHARRDLVALVKAAALVEFNGKDYARYLSEVFHDDEAFKAAAVYWAEEEVQHGEALRRWAEIADPTFDFKKSFHDFSTGYQLPVNVESSVRGSRSGELIARCVVETGTSSYYTAIAESTDEPVLKAICFKIAADELRHYKLFYTHLKHYLEREKIGRLRRLKIALSRITESEDDELSYAFFAAHNDGTTAYDRKLFGGRYLACATALYRPRHTDRMASMILKAIGIKPAGLMGRFASKAAWSAMRWRARSLAAYRLQVMNGVHEAVQQKAAA